MPRSRGSSDGPPQRQSPRVPLHLRTTACSEANSVHRPVAAERSPKVSPRGVLQERKRGTKVADLESKLSKARGELKKLRDQLASAEAAKIEAERALAKAKKQIPDAAPPTRDGEREEAEEEKPPPVEDAGEVVNLQQENKPEEESVASPVTTDVFEVVIPPEPVHSENEVDGKNEGGGTAAGREDEETKTMIEKANGSDEDGKAAEDEERKEEERKSKTPVAVPQIPALRDLRAKLFEKEKEVEILLEENVIFKANAESAAKKIFGDAQAKEADLTAKLSSMEGELEESRARADRLAEQLQAAEGAKAALEADMKRLRVQTEQWRKAAEAAAAALAGDDDRVGAYADGGAGEQCGSYIAARHVGWGSPLVEEDAAGGGGRRKGGGMRVFGDLWKKKGHEK